MSFKELLKEKTEQAERIIYSFLPKEEGFPAKVIGAMNYSMQAGGKRLRPILMKESFAMFGGEGRVVEPFMAAMEMIHTHSLIHDDLPCIDNDQYRRGKLTTHAVYGEAFGVLSGDALLNYAYETALKAFDRTEHPERVMQALKILTAKTGIYGMLGGQSVDVENEKNDGKALDRKTLEYIYLNKTSALLEAPLMIGAVLAGAAEEAVAVMEQVGRRTGLAFQIQDDILDQTSTTEVLGKPVHSDEENQKTTYVTLLGLDAASETVQTLTAEAVAALAQLPDANPFLKELLLYLAGRKK